MSRRIWVATALWLGACLAGAQGTIKNVFVKGNEHVSNEAILLHLTAKAGQIYSPGSVSKDKQALEGMGFFEGVEILATPTADSNWDLTVQVKEWPVVKELRVVGNKAIKTEDI